MKSLLFLSVLLIADVAENAIVAKDEDSDFEMSKDEVLTEERSPNCWTAFIAGFRRSGAGKSGSPQKQSSSTSVAKPRSLAGPDLNHNEAPTTSKKLARSLTQGSTALNRPEVAPKWLQKAQSSAGGFLGPQKTKVHLKPPELQLTPSLIDCGAWDLLSYEIPRPPWLAIFQDGKEQFSGTLINSGSALTHADNFPKPPKEIPTTDMKVYLGRNKIPESSEDVPFWQIKSVAMDESVPGIALVMFKTTVIFDEIQTPIVRPICFPQWGFPVHHLEWLSVLVRDEADGLPRYGTVALQSGEPGNDQRVPLSFPKASQKYKALPGGTVAIETESDRYIMVGILADENGFLDVNGHQVRDWLNRESQGNLIWEKETDPKQTFEKTTGTFDGVRHRRTVKWIKNLDKPQPWWVWIEFNDEHSVGFLIGSQLVFTMNIERPTSSAKERKFLESCKVYLGANEWPVKIPQMYETITRSATKPGPEKYEFRLLVLKNKLNFVDMDGTSALCLPDRKQIPFTKGQSFVVSTTTSISVNDLTTGKKTKKDELDWKVYPVTAEPEVNTPLLLPYSSQVAVGGPAMLEIEGHGYILIGVTFTSLAPDVNNEGGSAAIINVNTEDIRKWLSKSADGLEIWTNELPAGENVGQAQ